MKLNIFRLLLLVFFTGCVETKINPGVLNSGSAAIFYTKLNASTLGIGNHIGLYGDWNATWNTTRPLRLTKSVCGAEIVSVHDGTYSAGRVEIYSNGSMISGGGFWSENVNISKETFIKHNFGVTVNAGSQITLLVDTAFAGSGDIEFYVFFQGC
jgi:hypothetical protein